METQLVINDVRRKLSLGHTKDAISLLENFLEGSPKRDHIILQSARLNTLEKQLQEGMITMELANVEGNNINKALINMAREMEEEMCGDVVAAPLGYYVRVYFFACDFEVSELKKAIVRQNTRQHIFEFEIINWPLWSGSPDLEKDIRERHFDSKLALVDSIIENIRQFPQKQKEANTIDLVITSFHLPGNFYSWNNRDRTGIVISHGKIEQIFNADPQSIQAMIIRVMQRMLIYAMHIPGLEAHEATRGCVFDFTVDIRDLKNSIEINYLCRHCEKIISADEKGRSVLKQLNKWIDNLILEK